MPLFATNTRFVAPRPPPMPIECDQPNLSSFFGRLALQPERTYTKQGGYESASTVGQAVRAIEVCYTGLPKLHLRMLRSFVERTIRHARLVVAAAESRNFGDDPRSVANLSTLLDHSVQMLRREVVRAIRHEQLELRWSTGETSRPNKHSLRGTKSSLTSFVNRVCYAVTRELGCFARPLLPLAPGIHASDMEVDSVWNPVSLGIWWDDRLGWIVESTHEVESSEVSTDIEEGRLVVGGEDSEGEGGRGTGTGTGNSESCNREKEEDVYEDGSTREGSISDDSMGEVSE